MRQEYGRLDKVFIYAIINEVVSGASLAPKRIGQSKGSGVRWKGGGLAVRASSLTTQSKPPDYFLRTTCNFNFFKIEFIYMLTKRTKSNIISEHQKHEKDTGSAQVQVAVTTKEIERLASHLKKNPKDHHSRRGLLKMVSKRRRLLSYLRKREPSAYEKIIKKLDLKK